MAIAALAMHQAQVTARLAGAATAWRERTGSTRTHPERDALESAIREARASAPDAFDAGWRAGSLMNIDQALAEAAAVRIAT